MRFRAAAVVIPAHNEEELLPTCLAAVSIAAGQPQLAGVHVLTVVVADACRDRTADIARQAGALVVPAHGPNPGKARAIGTERALRELGTPDSETWIAATDADSEVPPQWLVHHAQSAAEGWEAVVGTVTVRTTAAVARRHQADYEATRPRDGAPWQHPHVHGANLGLTARAYCDIGGFLPLDVGEDRALVAALESRGHRVLRSAVSPVVTSARPHGRARAGFANHMAALLSGPPPAADEESAS
ncbi:glycosyltransferase [Streptomyces sp. NBC_01198]|uniref:glycosyltransferase n=1 Tax=Streptomyces sp. NBC_01198 TaxID=2903769 RepID=UPI002E119C46|nr:glycosyltransferase [Streptomyces sp. NBC_01198]